jgi:hypothetical protein
MATDTETRTAAGNGIPPEDPPDTPEQAEPTSELVISAGGQLTLNVGGGKQPTTSTLRLVGGKIEVDGQFAKGETIVVRIEAVVNEIGFKDQEDSKTGQVVGCERRHRARITGVAVV